MKIYNDRIALQSQKKREVFNITTQVKAAAEKSGLRDGVVIVSSLHPNTAVIVNEDDQRPRDNLFEWLDDISLIHENNRPQGQLENGAPAHLPSLLLNHQAIVPFTEGRLDLGPNQAVLFIELDGVRPRGILVKVMGE